MNNITIQDKMQKALEIICTLYKKDSIKEAYIVGSFAKSVIENIPFKETSDIDTIIVNPLFELDPGDVNMPVQENVINALREIGASFKYITLPLSKQFPDAFPEDYLYFSYVIYKNDVFHIMPFWEMEVSIVDGLMPTNISISNDDCKNFLTNR